MRSRRSAAVIGSCFVLLGALVGAGGCASSGGATAGDTSVVSSHPAAADQLEFFDALEARPRVSYDDAIHAALLLEQEDSQTDYQRRVAVARQNGLLPGDFDRPAHGAITTGEASDLVMRALVSRAGGAQSQGGAISTPAGATAQFQAAGVLPDSAGVRDTISGRDFVGLLAGAREMIGLAPAREPTVLAAAAPADAAESFDEPAAKSTPAAPAPTLELAATPEPAPTPTPTNEPLVAPAAAPAPTQTAAAPAQPKPASGGAPPATEAPKTKPAKDRRWVPGKPVKPPTPAPKSGG